MKYRLTTMTREPHLPKRRTGRAGVALTATLLAAASGGCVTVNAPDHPIVINLNISVTQEVVYRLDNEARSLIQQNPGIF